MKRPMKPRKATPRPELGVCRAKHCQRTACFEVRAGGRKVPLCEGHWGDWPFDVELKDHGPQSAQKEAVKPKERTVGSKYELKDGVHTVADTSPHGCRIVGCGRPAVSRGLCRGHRDWTRQNGCYEGWARPSRQGRHPHQFAEDVAKAPEPAPVEPVPVVVVPPVVAPPVKAPAPTPAACSAVEAQELARELAKRQAAAEGLSDLLSLAHPRLMHVVDELNLTAPAQALLREHIDHAVDVVARELNGIARGEVACG